MRFSLFYLLWSLKMSYLCLAFLLYIFIFVWRNKVSNIWSFRHCQVKNTIRKNIWLWKMKFLEASCGFVICHESFKLSRLCICFVWTTKKAQNKTYLIEELVNALSKAVGSLRVLRFLPARKVDRVVWVIKKWLTLRKLSN